VYNAPMHKGPKGHHGQRMSHYMVDCFYPDKGQSDGFRTESFPIKVSNETEAINEAKRAAFGKKPHHFHVRAVDRKDGLVIFSSEYA
jgi:hypothetical protein